MKPTLYTKNMRTFSSTHGAYAQKALAYFNWLANKNPKKLSFVFQTKREVALSLKPKNGGTLRSIKPKTKPLVNQKTFTYIYKKIKQIQAAIIHLQKRLAA